MNINDFSFYGFLRANKDRMIFNLMMLISVFFFQFCGSTKVVSQPTYSYEEDLSLHRPVVESKVIDTATPERVQLTETSINPTHHIKSELDSVFVLMKEARKSIRYFDGYSIQLYSGIDREMATNIKGRAYGIIDGELPKLIYDQPNYRVKVGKYYTKYEANTHFNILKKKFVRSILVPEKIRIASK